ncbi:VSP [Giardia lamblia P15]|uniref:VSP n=1 Tax=Giardia intestinalis (strain P15) TaxID=658858 RepID=E1F9U1_GIAIA|nr:VSP [Giardia lamblia P15]
MLYIAVLAFTWLALADLAPKSCDGDGATSCAPGTNCLDVKVAGQPKEVCTKCESTHVPIDGACKPKAPEEDKCSRPTEGDDGTCAACKGAYYLYKGGCYTKCPQGTPNSETNTCDGAPAPDCNVPNCDTCSEDKRTCEACRSGYFLTPEKNDCLISCPGGSYATGRTCTPCHSTCSSCSDATENSCTTCYPGSVLSRNGGKATGACIPECTGGYAENCEATRCTAVVGGSKYCSKCRTGYAPVDGICVSTASRAPAGCTPGDGVCDACTGTYFLQSGGCYNAGTFPGNTSCIVASGDGKCATCANGQDADPQTGSCPSCPANCSKCSGDSSAKTCTECYSGYYLDAGKVCKKCSETSGNIQGVPSCMSCKAPSSPSALTPVTCYVTQQRTDDGAGGSVNKGGLSTGAIAGIAVAVVIVVGGLVGFLCWWFLCRGKA